jgi:hypothetical protein
MEFFANHIMPLLRSKRDSHHLESERTSNKWKKRPIDKIFIRAGDCMVYAVAMVVRPFKKKRSKDWKTEDNY